MLKSIGDFGLGNRNERGDRLIQLCQEHDFFVANTCFELPTRRIYTWKSNTETEEKIVRNQIDYILVKNRHRNSLKSAKTYPGMDIGSDHNPVIAVINIKLKKVVEKKQGYKMDRTQLTTETKKEQVKKLVNDSFKKQDVTIDIKQEWNEIKISLNKICVDNLKSNKIKKKSWMTDEIIDLMEHRRVSKNDKNMYKQLQTKIRQKIRQAKTEYLTNQCKIIEELEKKHDSFDMHKRVKEVAGLYRERNAGLLCDEQGNTIFELEGKLKE